MFDIVRERLRQGHKTVAFPAVEPVLPPRFRGLPKLTCSAAGLAPGNAASGPAGCRQCLDVCPTGALTFKDQMRIDLGKCIFCGACADHCPEKAIAFTREFNLAASRRDDLLVRDYLPELERAVVTRVKRIFGRSLKLRQVSAGGCNACEADINVLSTIVFDLGRFGIQIVASPRHADGLLVTGPVTKNMELALRKTYNAVPDPKIVIAVGACAISGGIFAGLTEQNNGAAAIVPVDLFIPGCPPHPYTILAGLLSLLGKLERSRPAALNN